MSHAPEDAELNRAPSVPDDQPAWVFDVENERMVWANDPACQFWGEPDGLAHLLARDFSTDMSDATRTRLQSYMEAFQRGEVIEEQWTFYPAGEPKTLRLRAQGCELTDGRTAMLCQALPETARPDAVRAVEALRHASVMITLCSPDGERVLLENPAALRAYDFTQRPDANALTERFYDAQVVEQIQAQVNGRRPWRGDARVKTRDGLKWHAVDVRPTVDPATGEPMILIDEADIAYAKQIERELRETQSMLEERVERRTAELQVGERLASVGTLAAGVAHELNNPLAYIQSNLELLRLTFEEEGSSMNFEPKDIRAIVRECLEGTRRMAGIVHELSAFARPVSDDTGEPVPLGQLLDSAIRLAGSETRHRAELVRGYDTEVHRVGVDQRLGQVLLNLLVNAAQSIQPGDVKNNRISVRCTVHRERAQVEVEDTGSGIPEDQLNRVFDPFFTTKPVGKGTGLGLFLCQRIIQKLGGQIELVPGSEGRGTLARVMVPTRELIFEKPQPLERPRRGLKLLVVDDERLLRRSIRRTLKGHEVFEAESGTAAMQLMRAGHRFDVVLCDLGMPDGTGMDLYHYVSAAMPDMAKRMVFMTGGAFTADMKSFLESNPERVLRKPIQVDRLLDLLGRYS